MVELEHGIRRGGGRSPLVVTSRPRTVGIGVSIPSQTTACLPSRHGGMCDALCLLFTSYQAMERVSEADLPPRHRSFARSHARHCRSLLAGCNATRALRRQSHYSLPRSSSLFPSPLFFIHATPAHPPHITRSLPLRFLPNPSIHPKCRPSRGPASPLGSQAPNPPASVTSVNRLPPLPPPQSSM